MGIQDEGTVSFSVRHENKDWWSDASVYDFGTFDAPCGVTVTAIKHSDRTVELNISGPLGRAFHFRRIVPSCDERGLVVAVTWKDDTVTLYLNGVEVESQQLTQGT